MMMLDRLPHKANAPRSMKLTLLGMVTLFRLLQRAKVSLAIKETPRGMLKLDNLLQELKALLPIALTLVEMTMLVRLPQEEKTPFSYTAELSPIERTFVGITTEDTDEYANAPFARLVMAIDTTIAPLPHADTGVYLSTQPVVLPAPTE